MLKTNTKNLDGANKRQKTTGDSENSNKQCEAILARGSLAPDAKWLHPSATANHKPF
jgi:hypothetical protein